MGAGAGFTLGRLAEVLNATLDAHPERVVMGVAPLASAGASQLAYVADRGHLDAARASRAGAFLAPGDVSGLPAPTLTCRDPRLALAEVLALFHPSMPPTPGIDAAARVAGDARVDPTASIGAFVVVEPGAAIGPRVRLHPLVYIGSGVEIGEESVLFPHVVVYPRCRIGRRVIVHGGAVIGADGFGFIPGADHHRKIPQVGIVVVEDDVEIGANTAIDRATLGETVVGRGSKLDNLVQVGHNVEIGERTLMAAQVGIGGSSRIGAAAVLGGQVGIADHVTVGEAAVLGAQAGTTQDVAAGERVSGSWARPVAQAMRIWHAEAQLPDLLHDVKKLARRVAALEARLGGPRTDDPR
jgi:UDP-3-O-[3-hydroxymyristoyl] glucosamine N-acyltransferase